MKRRDLATSAFRFVLIIGVANLFADMTYEGARGVTGPFLGSLGARADESVLPRALTWRFHCRWRSRAKFVRLSLRLIVKKF
jgi:hypothetical protein